MKQSAINWPDMYFGPINLYSMPRQAFPHMYLELETKYCLGTKNLLESREEFNRLWNDRSKNG